VLDAPGWHVEARVIPWSGVFSVSPEQVVALSATMVVRAGQLYSMSRVLERSPLWLAMAPLLHSQPELTAQEQAYILLVTMLVASIEACALLQQPFSPRATVRFSNS
jgi:hypothetical protein